MSKGRYIVAIDVGTGSARCIVFDVEKKRSVSSSQSEWTHPTLPQYPGSQVFDTERNWSIVCQCIRGAMAKGRISPDQVLGVGATSMREGFVLYDKNGKAIWGCTNADSRATKEVVELQKLPFAEKLYFTGGDWFGMSAPPRLLWIKKHQPEIYKQIAHLTMLSDWVLCKLTDNFTTEPSVGSSSGLFDLRRRSWSKWTTEVLDLPRGIYPDIHESCQIIGEVTPTASEETGLKRATPVVTAGADTQMALLGVGAIRPFSYTIVGGSFWQTTVVTESPLLDPKIRLRTLCHAVSNRWMTEGIGFYCGVAVRWFRDAFCQLEKKIAEEKNIDAYLVLEKLAEEAPPGSNGIISIFSDLHNAKHWKHASSAFMQWNILAPEKFGKKEFFRSLEENAAYVARGHLENVLELTKQSPKEVVFCGGASKGALWPKILADVLDFPIRIPTVKESSCLGVTMCVGTAVGVYSDLNESVKELVSWERSYTPNRQNHERYMDHYQKWRAVYQRCLQMVEEGLLRPMWAAPGS